MITVGDVLRRILRASTIWCSVVVLVAAIPAVSEPKPDRYPAIGAGYVPTDPDERGLWMQFEAVERAMKTSDALVRDPALDRYVRGVLCRTVGEAACSSLRLYIVRNPSFNASMAANGMVTVHTGALLRMRNEAQLAAVLGHEFTHFARRHSLQTLRDTRSKTGRLAMLSAIPVSKRGSAVAIEVARLLTVGSQYSFSRDMEREADAGSIPLMVAAGYDPALAASTWQALINEDEAALIARRRRIRWRENSFYATHPSRPERIATLTGLARPFAARAFPDNGAETHRAAMRSWWPQLVDEQIKLNDFGGSDWLLRELAADGWTPDLLYARGELYRTRGRREDLGRAAAFYRQALSGDAPVEAWRGLGLVLLRSGDVAAGQGALKTYLERKADATDRAMIAMLAGQAQ